MAGEIISIEVEGLDDLRRQLILLPQEIADKELRATSFAGAKAVRDIAKGLLVHVHGAVDTGSLRDAIRVGFDKGNSSAVQKQFNVFVKHKMKKYVNNRRNRRDARVGRKYRDYGDLFYWRFIEFGTSRQRARPFLRPALDENKDLVTDVMRARLEKGIDRQIRKLNMLKYEKG
jgi:HK97 gp10 family phage protein